LSQITGARHRGEYVPKHRVARAFGFFVLTVTIGLGLFTAYTYRTLSGDLNVLDVEDQLSDRPDKPDLEKPKEPLNVLIMGSDSRQGFSGEFNEGGGLSDTTILVHLSADRQHAYGVSLPRDAMVERPDCYRKDGSVIPGGFAMWNAAFSLGGPACTIQQTEQLTGIRIDHFVVLDFNGFKDMVDAIDGVEICIPETVDDPIGHIYLEAGTRTVRGQEALDYVRIRHNISANGDIGRMKRQQAFIASMANKVMSSDVLARPDRLIGFLRAAVKSITVDPGLGSPLKIANLASEFSDTGLDEVKFITVPWDFYEPDPNRLVWANDANLLWQKMKFDQPLRGSLASEAISAAQRPGSTATAAPDPTASPTDDPTDQPSTEPTRSAEEIAAENGLCA